MAAGRVPASPTGSACSQDLSGQAGKLIAKGFFFFMVADMKLVLLMRAGEVVKSQGHLSPFFCVAVASGMCLFSLPGPWQQALPSPGPAALGGRQLRHSTTLCSYLARVFHLHKAQKLYLI